MTDEQIVKYARDIISLNLLNREFVSDAVMVRLDDEILLEHIIGVMNLFEKAKEILEGRMMNN